MKDTSWEKVSSKYNKNLADKGDYYHLNLVIPKSLELLKLNENSKVLDLACGQGVLARHLPKNTSYLGIDLSESLIEFAKKYEIQSNHSFIVGDITKPLNIGSQTFTHSTIILALQNTGKVANVLFNAAKYIKKGGKLLIVINHPHYRIPRHSSWEIDEKNNIQYRKINKYLSKIEIPVNHDPSKGAKGNFSISYHFSLESLSKDLFEAGFYIEKIEEWSSDKKSVGKNSKRENVSRSEIPLFMCLLCTKN